MRIIALLAALILAPLPAAAHKVVFGIFPSGDKIEGELGFSNGDMAVSETVEVFDPEGNKLGEAVTDDDGFFLYTPTTPVAHQFRADLGAGHVAEATMSAEEVAKIIAVGEELAAAEAGTPAAAPGAGGVTVASLTTEERLAIAEAVHEEIRPLRQEISAYKEHNSFQTVLGGIGYIIGLFGLGFYFVARRRFQG
ncbi:MAG: cobalt ABC transporter permease [Rhodobacterales bacterium]|nr:MAG: cobalt ABC transporter permease [Rhodobacterales bacterium]